MEYKICHIEECEKEFGRGNLLTKTQQISLWAKQLILQQTGLQLDIVYSANGKPVFRDKPSVHFSISHASNFIAVAFSDKEIGIDIEPLRIGKQAVAKRFFSPEENDYLSQLPSDAFDLSFTRLWTLKEAYVKCIGEGISNNFLNTTIDLQSLLVKGKEHSFVLTSLFDKTTQLFVAICQKQ